MLAAADPAAQLVELREPVALGPLDQHHGRVGDVDPDLDHARRHQHVGLARRRTRSIAALPSSREGIWPCSRPTLKSAELAGRAAARPRSVAAFASSFSDSLDQRADDEGLPPLAQPLADELVGAGALLLPHHPGLDRLPARGQLAQGGRVEVAVGGQRERARDRRRGHVERRAAAAPPGPFASSAARWRTPKRCCSSTTADARAGRTRRRARSARGCRPPARARPTRGGRAARAGARRGVAPVSSVNGAAGSRRRAAGLERRAQCCSASVSVGAISAAWCPASTARSIA